MSSETTKALPKLLKARQYHSRIFAVVVVAALLVAEPMMGWGHMRNFFMLVGYAMIIFGAFGRAYCTVFIGGRKNDVVVRSGPFSVVRNPLYVFSFIAMVGVGLQSGMITLTALLVVAFMFYYPMVVAKEEGFLSHKFGEPYEAYKREVPRWIPNLKLWNEPEHTETQPKFVRRTMGDAAIFFLALPCFILISILQGSGILPVWFVIP
ncbi:MAG: isoprenylcysteine carboxylmethyltransferase family protein [Alphaproteobacteria bacterium]